MEIWKDITGYEGIYQISSYGRVKNIKRNKGLIRKLCLNGRGYCHITLSNKNVFSTKTIHQLVAIAFLNHTKCGYKLVVNHKDFNKLNNHVDNLEIVTQRENANHKHIKSSSIYTGVSWNKLAKKWTSHIFIDKKLNHLGYFTDELEASNAYQKKLKEITL